MSTHTFQQRIISLLPILKSTFWEVYFIYLCMVLVCVCPRKVMEKRVMTTWSSTSPTRYKILPAHYQSTILCYLLRKCELFRFNAYRIQCLPEEVLHTLLGRMGWTKVAC